MAEDIPGGNVEDEGNLYEPSTGWGAGPIA